MVLATKFCIILAASAAIVSLICIGTEAFFDKVFHPDSLGSEIGDWTVCFVWIGGGVGTLAWLKQWVDNPSFNTGTFDHVLRVCNIRLKNVNHRLFHGRGHIIHRCRQRRRGKQASRGVAHSSHRR